MQTHTEATRRGDRVTVQLPVDASQAVIYIQRTDGSISDTKFDARVLAATGAQPASIAATIGQLVAIGLEGRQGGAR